MDALFVGFLALVAVVLLCLERVAIELVAVGLIVALTASGILTGPEALRGFGNEAVIVIAGLFVLSAALQTSGALDRLAGWIQRRAGADGHRSDLILLGVVMLVSALMSNTTTTAVFLPVAVALARAYGRPPALILMPLAFASILGGSVTLIGTSTNVIVSGLLPRYDEPPLGMLELAPIAVPIAVLGLLYLRFAAPRILAPTHDAQSDDRETLGAYLAEVRIPPRSTLAGVTLLDARLGSRARVDVVARLDGDVLAVLGPEERLEAGDPLLVEGRLEDLLALENAGELEILHSPARRDHGMSNQAAALVVLPVAMEVASEAAIDPRAMAVTIALAASNSFLTPLEPSCLLVYGPGRYRFFDFTRLGAALTFLAWLLTMILVRPLWPWTAP